MRRIVSSSVLTVLFCFHMQAQSPSSCALLASLAFPNTTITSSQDVTADTSRPSGIQLVAPPALSNFPAFCRVTATLRPTSDSDIKIEVWLPSTRWNGKLQSVGNPAWGGVIPYRALASALTSGYATAATDTGHAGNSPRFAVGHPEKLADYGYRAVHEMTIAAKSIIAAFYGTEPTRSYWNGCSTGGRQGLMEAQRYPADYDGIIVGAPVNYREEQLIWQIWIAQAVHNNEHSYIPPEKYSLLHRAALNACDAHDGLRDGLIDSPKQCRFDPKALQCSGADRSTCLTAQQVEATRKIYSPLLNPRTSQEIYPGLERGSELGWAALAGSKPSAEAVDFFKYLVFNDPLWDFRTLNFETALAAVAKTDRNFINATDTNLKPFFDRGGKLLVYHGWTDELAAPSRTVSYYERVVQASGGIAKASASIRLFMMPGVNHCSGGEGPDAFDKVGVLDKWVTQGEVPDQITASHTTSGKADRTRPLCPYPQVPKYKGNGSIDDAANFVCKSPE